MLILFGMSRFFRFFSRRGGGQKGVKEKEDKALKNILPCRVMLLDGSDLSVNVPVSINVACLFIDVPVRFNRIIYSVCH